MHCVYSFNDVLFNFDAVLSGLSSYRSAFYIILLCASLCAIPAGVLGIIGILFKQKSQIIVSISMYSFVFITYIPAQILGSRISAGLIFMMVYTLTLIIVIGVGLCQINQFYSFYMTMQQLNQGIIQPQNAPQIYIPPNQVPLAQGQGPLVLKQRPEDFVQQVKV